MRRRAPSHCHPGGRSSTTDSGRVGQGQQADGGAAGSGGHRGAPAEPLKAPAPQPPRRRPHRPASWAARSAHARARSGPGGHSDRHRPRQQQVSMMYRTAVRLPLLVAEGCPCNSTHRADAPSRQARPRPIPKGNADTPGEPASPMSRRITGRQHVGAVSVTDERFAVAHGSAATAPSGQIAGRSAIAAGHRAVGEQPATHPPDDSRSSVGCNVVIISTTSSPRPRPRTGAAPIWMHAVTASTVSITARPRRVEGVFRL